MCIRDRFILGPLDGFLYFFAEFDRDIGTELYRINLGISTSTSDINIDLNVQFLPTLTNALRLQTDINEEIQVEAFTLGGQLLKRQMMQNNETIELNYSGLVLLKARTNKGSKTSTMFVSY